ncbi:hypothetical protein DPMN_098367, partial [Dreissena polymorpha]
MERISPPLPGSSSKDTGNLDLAVDKLDIDGSVVFRRKKLVIRLANVDGRAGGRAGGRAEQA